MIIHGTLDLEATLQTLFLITSIRVGAAKITRTSPSQSLVLKCSDGLDVPVDRLFSDQQAYTNTIHNMELLLLGYCFIAANAALERRYGKDKFNNNDPNITAIRVVVSQVRNAWAHNPVTPTWNITSLKCKQPWSIKLSTSGKVIIVDLSNKHEQMLHVNDIGGDDIIHLLMTVRTLLAGTEVGLVTRA